MFDFIDWLITNRNKPLDYILLAALVFIIDRFGRKFITSQVKRLFHVDDKSQFKEYVKNQQRIEDKVDLLLQKEGITWNAPTLQPDLRDTATRRRWPYLLPSAALSLAQDVKQFINWRVKRMSNINKGILLPLLSAIALFVKQVWGFEINDEQINFYADVALYLIMFIGLFIKPKKEKALPQQQEEVEGYYH